MEKKESDSWGEFWEEITGLPEHSPTAFPMRDLSSRVRLMEGVAELSRVHAKEVAKVVEKYPDLLSDIGLEVITSEVYESWTLPDWGGFKPIAQATQTRVPELAYLLAKRGNPTKAIVWIEQFRTRAYREFLALRNVSSEGVAEEDWVEFSDLRNLVYDLQLRQWAKSESAVSLLIMSRQLFDAYKELDNKIADIRKYKPDFVPLTLQFTDIANAAEPGNPLIYMFATCQGTIAAIIENGCKEITDSDVVWLNDFTLDDLDEVLGIVTSTLREPVEKEPSWYVDKENPDYVLHGANWNLGQGFLLSLMHGDNRIMTDLEVLFPILEKRLMQPLATELSEKRFERVTIIPCGRLALLPLHAISLGDANFLDRFQVSYAPSASILLQCRKSLCKSEVTTPPSMLGIVNPTHTPSLPYLIFADAEMQSISNLFGEPHSCVLRDEDATFDKVVEQMPNHSYWHFACHGMFLANAPMQSGLLLGRKDRLTAAMLLSATPADGKTTVTRRLRLTVLSACQTSVADFDIAPDESLGLASTCLLAGVPGVIGTQWPVNDISTALLMERFYYYHLQGDPDENIDPMSPSVALNRAQRWLRDITNHDLATHIAREAPAFLQAMEIGARSIAQSKAAELLKSFTHPSQPDARPFAHPYYWAGFTFNGV